MYLHVFPELYPHMTFMDFYLDLSIIQVAQASSIFIFCRYIYQDVSGIFKACKSVLENNYINHFIMSVRRTSYGMYLFHLFAVKLLRLYKILPFKINSHTILFVDITFALVLFIVSWLVVLLINRIPILNKISVMLNALSLKCNDLKN